MTGIKSSAAARVWNDSLWPFLRYLGPQFVKDRCLYVAAALTLASLLAMVPVLTVTLSVYATFPTFQRATGELQEFVFRHFVPSTGSVVQQHLDRFVTQASGIRVLGMLLFVAAALLLIKAIDKAFNDIWQVKTGRPAIRTFLLYWAVLTLGPVVLSTSIGLTSYLTAPSSFSDVMSDFGLQQLIYSIIPLILSALAFTLLYRTVPNRTVNLVHALVGGCVAAILLELAKRGFGLYVSWVPTYRLVFGALAFLPLFLSWLYLSWIVILLGAEIAHALAVFRPHQQRHLLDRFTLSYRLLGHLRGAHSKGDSLPVKALLEAEPTLSEEIVREILDALMQAHLVAVLEDGSFMLARDLREITLGEFYRLLPWRLPSRDPQEPEPPVGKEEAAETPYGQTLGNASRALDQALNIPLERLLTSK